MTTIRQFFTFVCNSCGHSWSEENAHLRMVVECPECGHQQKNRPAGQMSLLDNDATYGFFECYDCHHSFTYVASENEEVDAPDCPNCHSSNVATV